MAHAAYLATLVANTAADAIAPLFNSGYLRIYSGTRPVTADTAIGSQVLLAEPRFNATAFVASSGGVLVANAITADASANNSGTATWFRAFKSDGTTALLDGTVGTSDADLVLVSVTITAGAPLAVSSLQLTVPLQ